VTGHGLVPYLIIIWSELHTMPSTSIYPSWTILVDLFDSFLR